VPPRSFSFDGTQPDRRIRRVRGVALFAVAAAALAPASPALAQSGGRGVAGGTTFLTKPQVAKVTCLRGCASRRRAQGGSVLKLAGRYLSSATEVAFHGSYGRRDDRVARVRPRRASSLLVRVPLGAVSGPLSVKAAGGMRSARTRALAILPAPPPEPNTQLTPVPGLPGVETGTSRTKLFYGGRGVKFSFRITESQPEPLRIDLVNAADGSVVQSWTPAVVQGQVQSVTWDGHVGGLPAAPGRYGFRIGAPSGTLARSSQAGDARDAFDLYDHIFPIRARHAFGSAGARFGAGRGGRSHQGHDVFAACGARLVAARGGTVQYSGYHRLAGYYLVIDGDGTDVDYAYMHLAEPTPFREGDRVYTGQRIGSVGQTGNARGCHLHFEMWAAPGWYEGGRPFDPLPSLLAWDGWS
jgi:murein DD-endopeptidase MepM/ murein hydrolase activator NlpD